MLSWQNLTQHILLHLKTLPHNFEDKQNFYRFVL